LTVSLLTYLKSARKLYNLPTLQLFNFVHCSRSQREHPLISAIDWKTVDCKSFNGGKTLSPLLPSLWVIFGY